MDVILERLVSQVKTQQYNTIFIDDDFNNFVYNDIPSNLLNLFLDYDFIAMTNLEQLATVIEYSGANIEQHPLVSTVWQGYHNSVLGNLIYLNAGMSYELITQLITYIKNNEFKVIFFDWDLTISCWQGLFGNHTRVLFDDIKQKFTNHDPNILLQQLFWLLFGGQARFNLILQLFITIADKQAKGELQTVVITNQPDCCAIKLVLMELQNWLQCSMPARDLTSFIMHTPIIAQRERYRVPKLEYISNYLSNNCNSLQLGAI